MTQLELGPRPFAPDRARSAIFLDAARRRIVTDLVVHVTDGTGPLLLIGETGGGKTTLLQRVAEEASTQDIPLIVTAGSAPSLLGLLGTLEAAPAREPDGAATEGRLLGLDPVRPAALVIDDADQCPVAVWHKLARLLRDPELARMLPPILLAVTPELLDWIDELGLLEAAPDADRLKRIPPLAAADVGRYLGHRLKARGGGRPGLFPPEAIQRIAETTGGVPGRIDRISDEVVRIAAVRGDGWLANELIETVLTGRGAGAAAAVSPPRPAGLAGIGEGRWHTGDPATATSGFPGHEAARFSSAALMGFGGPNGLGERTASQPPRDEPRLDGSRLNDAGSLFRPRRPRRRWPKIAIAGGLAAGVGLIAIGAVMLLQQHPADDKLASAPTTTQPGPGPSRADPSRAEPWAAERMSPPASETPASSDLPSTLSQPGGASLVRDASPLTGGRRAITPSSPAATASAPASAPPAPASGDPTRPAAGKTAIVAAPLPPAERRPDAPATAHGSTGDGKTAANKATAGKPALTTAKAPTPAKQTGAAKPSPPPAAEAASNAGDAPTEDPVTPPRPVGEIIEMGDSFRASGDMDWARKFYRAAQERGSAKAAAALAATYDPRMVDPVNRPDPRRAKDLYDEAARHGDRDAARQRDELETWMNNNTSP